MARKNNNSTIFNPLTTALFVVSGVMFVMLTVMSTSYQQSVESNAAGKGGAPTYTGGDIVLKEDPTDLTLGSTVSFTTVSPKLKGSEYPMVLVSCHQDGQVVYGQLDHPDVTFTLGGGWSRWREVGGPAVCKATLYSYGGKEKGYDVINKLAETPEFSVK